jgi:hypothetical protein
LYEEGRRAGSDDSKMSFIEQPEEPKLIPSEAYISHPENSIAQERLMKQKSIIQVDDIKIKMIP